MNLGSDISCNVHKKLWSQIISNWIIRLRRGKLTFTKILSRNWLLYDTKDKSQLKKRIVLLRYRCNITFEYLIIFIIK